MINEVSMIHPLQDGDTSLIAAAQTGREAMVRLLLERKADPSATTQVQATPCAALGNLQNCISTTPTPLSAELSYHSPQFIHAHNKAIVQFLTFYYPFSAG